MNGDNPHVPDGYADRLEQLDADVVPGPVVDTPHPSDPPAPATSSDSPGPDATAPDTDDEPG